MTAEQTHMSQEQMEKRLQHVEKELKEIKSRMVDKDSIMTEEDYQDLLNYRKEKDKGKLTSHEQLKKELDV